MSLYQRTYDESDEGMSFRVGEYQIPANYRGNAFTADEMPTNSTVHQSESTTSAEEPMCQEASTSKECHKAIQLESTPRACGKDVIKPGGLLSGLLRGIGRDIELDDIILIGLIILLLLEKKNGDADGNGEILILLVLLFLGGF